MMNDKPDFMDYLAGLETETSPSTKEQIGGTVTAVLGKAGLKRKLTGKKKIGRVLLIAAAIAVCAVVTVGATGFHFTDLIHNYFEAPNSSQKASVFTEEQLKTLHACGTPINQSAVSGGTTICLKSAVSDQSMAYLWMEVIAPKGTSLPRNDYDFSGDTIDFHSQNEQRSSSAFWDVIPQNDSTPNDNRKDFIIKISTGGIDLQGRELTLKLTDLSIPGKTNLSFVPVIKGTWKFEFKLSDSTPHKKISINHPEHFTSPSGVGGAVYTCTVKNITLSSFTAALEISNRSNSKTQPGMKESLTIHYKDGTQKSFRQLGGTGNEGNAILYFSFDSPIDVNNISSVTIGDLTIPVT